MLNGIASLAKILGGKISENSPSVLSSLAVAGVISTAVLAIQATPKALQLIELEKERKNGKRDGIISPIESDVLPSLGRWETAKLTYRIYLPAIGVGLGTICCIVQANSISQRRIAAIAGAYSLTEAAFREYQDKIVDTIGRNREQRVRDEIAAEKVYANPSESREVLVTGKGEVLCYDAQTGRYFKSSVETIRQAVNNLNLRLMREMYITLNEVFCEFGLKSIKNGDELGWHIDKGLIEVEFSTQLSDTNEPCLVLDYKVVPKHLK